jgi:hypothetical protein
VRCHLTRDALRAEFRDVSSVDTPDATIETAATFVVEDQQPGARAD